MVSPMTTEAALAGAAAVEGSVLRKVKRPEVRKALTVAVLVDSIAAGYGGPAYSVRRLWQSAMSQGVGVTVHSTDSFQVQESAADRELWQPLSCRQWRPFGLKALGYSSRMESGVQETLKGEAKVISQHGLWLHYGRVAMRVGRRERIPVIIHPHGMLEPWALKRSAWKKQLTGRLWEYENLRGAACLRVTSTKELQSVRDFGLKNPVALIPNGIDVEDYTSLPTTAEARALLPELTAKRVLLFLSRVHPKKGLAMLLRAWHILGPANEGWQLAIAGPDQKGHTDELRQLANELGLAEKVVFLGPLYGEKKLAAYKLSDLFVLPSFSENFGIAVAEALAAGLPVMTTDGTPWEDLMKHGCGWCVKATSESLAESLREAISLSKERLAAMGLRGREWMAQEFSWERLAAQMIEVCEWTVEGTDPSSAPACVSLD